MADETEVEATDILASTEPKDSKASNPKSRKASKQRNSAKDAEESADVKRRCVSTACIACRKRKSKCDGNTPSCAACSSVYGTECIYDPNSDHRRKGVYKKDIDNLKTRNSTLQTLIQAILNFPESDVPDLVKQIRSCDSLDEVAESILAREMGLVIQEEDTNSLSPDAEALGVVPQFEKELAGKMGKVKLDNGAVSIIGGTSNLIFVSDNGDNDDASSIIDDTNFVMLHQEPITSWTEVTKNSELIMHLLNMYFTWHYTYFTTMSKDLFWNDFKQGKPSKDAKYKTEYCTPLLVNAMLALGCHFTSWPEAREDPEDSATAGNHFFREAKKLMLINDEHEKPRLATVQALALMSVREAGCGREARGWVYSGMSFRMAYDLGLNIDSGTSAMEDSELDARRVTMWGCFLFDKCWSNYLGRQPQLPLSSIAVPKPDVFPTEDAETWHPYVDSGVNQTYSQPSRTRVVALQISQLCEISSDLLSHFYNPHQLDKPFVRQAELKKLSEIHTRLEAWRKNLPSELEPREGQLPHVLVMHMFFQLLFIHLFRPFLKYKQAASPLPAHVSPRKIITHSAATISKLLRLYRRTFGLRQICNIVVYIAHTACTVHLLNLPDKTAQRDIQHGLNHLEEIAEGWLCARRTLSILHLAATRWKIDLPEAAAKTLIRTEAKFGSIRTTPDPYFAPKVEEPPTYNMDAIPPHFTPPQQRPPYPQQPPQSFQQAPPFFPQATMHHPSPQTTPPSLSPEEVSLPPHPIPQAVSLPPSSQAYILPPHQPRGPSIPQNLSIQPPYQPPPQGQPQQTAPPPPPTNNPTITSPTALFGGVQGLIQDQEWWLRDSNAFFANWNVNPADENGVSRSSGPSPPGAMAQRQGPGPGQQQQGGGGYTAGPVDADVTVEGLGMGWQGWQGQ